MDLHARPLAPPPDEALPPAPTFTLTSTAGSNGDPLPHAQTAAGGSISPQLSWSGFPAETKSFFLTCFDPDAPTPAGYWHWAILDIPAEQTELPENAGYSDLELDGPAYHLPNDTGDANYFGAAPPAGDRPHRYVFTLHALDVDTLNLPDHTTPTTASFYALFHTIARASLTLTYQEPAA